MKVVISCASSKNGDSLIHEGQKVNFVSKPSLVKNAVKNDEVILYVHPDSLIPNRHLSWREMISQQNELNSFKPAYQLYKPSIYQELYNTFRQDLYIYSAGWGIIRADFRIPKYDITFKQASSEDTVRRSKDHFNDFNHLQGIPEGEQIVFLGGKDYVRPFCQLTKNLPNEKFIFYKDKMLLTAASDFLANRFKFIYYQTERRTNWHFEVASRFIKKTIQL